MSIIVIAGRRVPYGCARPSWACARSAAAQLRVGCALVFVTRVAICEMTSNASRPAQNDWCVVGNTVRARSGLLRGDAPAYDRFNRESDKEVVQHRGPLSRRIRGGRIKQHGYFVNLYHTGGARSALQTPRDVRAAARLRCATRDRALAIISHELRQPLNVIQMNARLLENLPASAGPSQLQGIAKAMRRAIESQTRLIDDLLDFSRLRTGKLALRRSEVDFGALALDLVAAFAARWPSGRLRAQVMAADPLICHADPVRLEQIVGNLLDNAMKFSPGSAQVQVRLTSEDGFARLAVADSGCGIAREFLPHIFGLFSQARAGEGGSRDGLGIGLALVHGLAVAHGGFVKATSAGPGRGAEFNVWLPLHRRA